MSEQQISTIKPLTFDYGALDRALATDARVVADRIRSRLKQSYLETGRDLLDMKARLGHGKFGAWLAAEFGMTARTAERYMGAARIDDAISDRMSDLQPATIQALAAPSLPEAVRAACIDRINAGISVLPRDVKKFVSDIRFKEAEQKRLEKTLPKSKAARAQAIADHEARQRDCAMRDAKAQEDRLVLANLIADALGDRRAEALRLLKRLKSWSIDRELIEALERGNQT